MPPKKIYESNKRNSCRGHHHDKWLTYLFTVCIRASAAPKYDLTGGLETFGAISSVFNFKVKIWASSTDISDWPFTHSIVL